MKRMSAMLLVMLFLLLVGCLAVGTETDYPAAIMAEGTVYLKSVSAMPAEIDESAIIGYTTSYTDTYPEKDGETNFNRELNMLMPEWRAASQSSMRMNGTCVGRRMRMLALAVERFRSMRNPPEKARTLLISIAPLSLRNRQRNCGKSLMMWIHG